MPTSTRPVELTAWPRIPTRKPIASRATNGEMDGSKASGKRGSGRGGGGLAERDRARRDGGDGRGEDERRAGLGERPVAAGEHGGDRVGGVADDAEAQPQVAGLARGVQR